MVRFQIVFAQLFLKLFENEFNRFKFPTFVSPPGGFRLTRIKMKNKKLELHTNGCDFCASVNAGGSLGTITAGKWNKIEMRLKLNDDGKANGEFLFFFEQGSISLKREK